MVRFKFTRQDLVHTHSRLVHTHNEPPLREGLRLKQLMLVLEARELAEKYARPHIDFDRRIIEDGVRA